MHMRMQNSKHYITFFYSIIFFKVVFVDINEFKLGLKIKVKNISLNILYNASLKSSTFFFYSCTLEYSVIVLLF